MARITVSVPSARAGFDKILDLTQISINPKSNSVSVDAEVIYVHDGAEFKEVGSPSNVSIGRMPTPDGQQEMGEAEVAFLAAIEPALVAYIQAKQSQ